MGAPGLSGIWTSAANTKVAGASLATERFNNGQREPHVVLSHAAVPDCVGLSENHSRPNGSALEIRSTPHLALRGELRKRALRRRRFISAKRVHRPDDRAHEAQSKIWSQNVQPRFQTS